MDDTDHLSSEELEQRSLDNRPVYERLDEQRPQEKPEFAEYEKKLVEAAKKAKKLAMEKTQRAKEERAMAEIARKGEFFTFRQLAKKTKAKVKREEGNKPIFTRFSGSHRPFSK